MVTDIDSIIKILEFETKKYKVPVVDLIKISGDSPYKILIATIISARTKDDITIKACKNLFAFADNFSKLEKLSETKIGELIYPAGFYKTKARHLKQIPKIIESAFFGNVPKTIPELITLPGVGRKTANLVLALAFNIPAICVDTHVHKIINRIGYIRTRTPLETEMRLRKKLPKKYWIITNKIFVTLGQHLCTPISPHCSICPIKHKCRRVGVGSSR